MPVADLHVDHYADLPYMLPFTATMGLRFKPLRVTGPSGHNRARGGRCRGAGIAATFMNARLRGRILLDSIMCVMDASQIFAAPEIMELKLRQIAFADMLILNKADLVGREEIGRIKAWLDDHFHRYCLVESIRGNVPLEILLSAGRFDAAQLDGEAAPGEHLSLQGSDPQHRRARRRGRGSIAAEFRPMHRHREMT